MPYAAGGGVAAMARALRPRRRRRAASRGWCTTAKAAAASSALPRSARARPDGYTVVFSPASPLTNSPFVVSKTPFQAEQIEPVCQVFENVFAIVVAESSPIRTLPDLVARAKARPGTVSYGARRAGLDPAPVGGGGGTAFAAAVQRHRLPRRRTGADRPAGRHAGLLAALGLSTIGGKPLRVLAVFADQPQPAQPNAPTITSFGYPSVSPGLNGLYVPAGTPRPVMDRIEAICKAVAQGAAFRDAAGKMGQLPQWLPAAPFKARIAATYKAHEALVPDLKLDKQ